MTTIGDLAFRVNALASLTIGNSVTTIGNQAFAFNNALASVTIGNSVNTIGTQAFYFNDLTSVTISDSVTTIGDQAFAVNSPHHPDYREQRDDHWEFGLSTTMTSPA